MTALQGWAKGVGPLAGAALDTYASGLSYLQVCVYYFECLFKNLVQMLSTSPLIFLGSWHFLLHTLHHPCLP